MEYENICLFVTGFLHIGYPFCLLIGVHNVHLFHLLCIICYSTYDIWSEFLVDMCSWVSYVFLYWFVITHSDNLFLLTSMFQRLVFTFMVSTDVRICPRSAILLFVFGLFHQFFIPVNTFLVSFLLFQLFLGI